MNVPIEYYFDFGKLHQSDVFEIEIELTPEEAEAYNAALRAARPLNEVPELEAALERAYEEIEAQEADAGAEIDDDVILKVRFQDPNND